MKVETIQALTPNAIREFFAGVRVYVDESARLKETNAPQRWRVRGLVQGIWVWRIAHNWAGAHLLQNYLARKGASFISHERVE